MKKPFFTFFISLFAIFLSGYGQLYAPVNSQSTYFSLATPSNVAVGEFAVAEQSQHVDPLTTKATTEIKVAEIDVEESEHACSEKLAYNSSFILYYLALLCLLNIFKTSLITNRLFLCVVPSKRYILFQVFRL
tara:strand:- start:5540 stop:5938 length:399 start_codon:yes stop_codon:yes gene_type:complete